MRKYQQKQLLDIIKTLRDATSEIKEKLLEKEVEIVLQILNDCQNGVVQVGEFIEALEGKGTRTVTLLEEYHEILYHASTELESNDGGFVKVLQKKLFEIENSIKDEIKPIMEVVFLPYKVSMWDSMESVWMAAKDDPQCDAYVVPIPYYDRLPGGAFGQMKYEGNLYPDYVPVVDWQTYDIEARHPDIIFIHNPYDGTNLVTSVHPNYYSERLKEWTDLLCYIPYFVALDNIAEHLTFIPGTLYADKVFLQSEKIRSLYVKTFKEFERKNKSIGKFGKTESKFVALGSPKFDKVLNTKLDHLAIPADWMRKIIRPDGSRKKVILYNTSIGALLEGNKKVLQKLYDVFHVFRNREDTVLLWRPHPLNETTYQAMRPQLAKEYMEIMNSFKKEDFGIYDDTSELHRAIAVSDAYYGDRSSLLALYDYVGKPVMLQNPDILQRDLPLHKLSFENLYYDGKDFWFTSLNFNGLFKMDKETSETKYMGSFPEEALNGYRLYGAITEQDDILYFAPVNAEAIAVYNKKNHEFSKIDLNRVQERKSPEGKILGKYHGAVTYNNKIFFLGFGQPFIISYDPSCGALDYFDGWAEKIDALSTVTDGYYFRFSCIIGSCIYAAALSSSAVLIFDMETCTSTVRKVGGGQNYYSGICHDGRNFWLASRRDGSITKWDPDTGEYKEFNDLPEGFAKVENAFCGIAYADDTIWLLPANENMGLKINIQDERITAIEEFPPGAYTFIRVIGSEIYTQTQNTKHLIINNPSTGERKEEPVLLARSDADKTELFSRKYYVKDIFACKESRQCYFYENRFITMDGFLTHIVHRDESDEVKALLNRQRDIFRKTNSRTDGTSGSEIFNYCRKIFRQG